MELIVLPAQLMGLIFITVPPAALIPALLFAWLFMRRRQLSAAVAAVAWVAYAGYESLMVLRVLCSGECNIRIDLLLIYPLLGLVSALALFMVWIRRRQRARSG